MRPSVLALLAFAAGAAAATVSARLMTPGPASPAEVKKEDAPSDDDALRKANANLTESLHTCDRQLADLRANVAPAATVANANANANANEEARPDGGRDRRSRRGAEPTKEDWERMAQTGTVRVRVPCVRDTPWVPPQRAVDRLGLAPTDVDTLKDAYARSNKRVLDQVRPLCAKVLGSAEIVDKVGASACMDAITNDARKGNPQGMREALTRVAEVQSGKRAAPKAAEGPAIEQLTLALTNEQRAFEADLAAKLGPEEAKRLAWAPELCAERRQFRATEDREER
jgi:hypothetical protein